MDKTIKLKSPQVNEWVYAENNNVGKKQDGFMKNEVPKFHISELSKEEAYEYAEEYKKTFIEKYNSLTMSN
jgi:hypothetical protein